MSELLPVIFARGQNEGIDPRLAPPEVHTVATNVRWRKDGRPAKRYGAAPISLTGLDSGGSDYATHPVNFIAQWRGQPIMGLGAGIRRLIGSVWSNIVEANANHLPHFSPGRHDPVARSEAAQLTSPTVATANGYLLYAWDDGNNVYYQIATTSGAIVLASKLLAVGRRARAVAVGNLIYIVYSLTSALSVATFDTTTLTVTATTALGTLSSVIAFFDAAPRPGGNDWLLIYQSAATTITTKLMSGATTPLVAATQTQATGAAPGDCPVAVAGTSTSRINCAWLEPATGAVKFVNYDSGLAALTGGPTTIETDPNNTAQPGIVVDDPTDAKIFWGGTTAAAPTFSYMRYATVSGGSVTVAPQTVAHVSPRSKPFYGAAGNTVAEDGPFIWVSTADAAWADQATYYLLRVNLINPITPANVQLWTPGLSDNPGATLLGASLHMSDVVQDAAATFYTVLSPTLTQSVFSGGQNIGIDSISFKSIFANQRSAARNTKTAGRALQCAGGILYEFNGSNEESGFMHFPVISASSAATAGGFLTASASYVYVAVFEWIDSQGRRHRSAPSDPFALTTTVGNKTGTLVISTLAAFARQGVPVIHVYRTLANIPGAYHRVTPASGAPSALGGSTGYVTFVDTISDAQAGGNEFTYTDGGVVANILPPPCELMALCNGRLWLGGQLDRNVITASKLLVDGEPSQFSDEAEFSVFLAEECTGLASLDGTVIAFAREAIYLVNGDGPSDQGIGSFNPPQKLPSDVGCTDWRSVVETSLGVLFQSKRGIYLLPRGFNAPIFVGAEVEDTMNSHPICLSATLVSLPSQSGQLGEITVRFVMVDADPATDSRCLVFDLRTQGWSVDSPVGGLSPVLGLSGTWNDTFVPTRSTAGALLSIWQEDPTRYDENGGYIITGLKTGDVRPFGVLGFGMFRRVAVLGEYRGNAQVTVGISIDGGTSESHIFQVTSADSPDGTVILDVTPATLEGTAIRVVVVDTQQGGSGPTEGFIAQALFIEHELIGKTKRLAAGRKS